MTPDPNDWRPVAEDPPTEGVVVETCVRGPSGDRLHLPLRRFGDRWYDAAYSPYFSYFYPTHWRPLT